MTTIAVMHDGAGHTWIGSDRQVTSGLAGQHKWVLHGPWALGYVGELRAGNILRHHAERVLAGETPYEITEAMRALFNEHGFESRPGSGDSQPDYRSAWLLARPGAAWSICSGLSYEPIKAGMLWARGSGAQYAIGAGAGAAIGIDPVQRAIEVAARFDVHTGADDIWVKELVA